MQCLSSGSLVASVETTSTSFRLNMHAQPHLFNDDMSSREVVLDMVILTALLVLTRADDLLSMSSFLPSVSSPSSSSPPASPVSSISTASTLVSSSPPRPRRRVRAATVNGHSAEPRQAPRHAFDVQRTASFLDFGEIHNPPNHHSTHGRALEALLTALDDAEAADSPPPPPYSPVEPRGAWSILSHHSHSHSHSHSPSKTPSLTRTVQGTVHRLRALNPDSTV